MSYSYIFEPLALNEYKQAVAWYEERSETAAKNIIAEIKERIMVICSDPLRYRNTFKHFREVSLKKFPYCIVYFVDEDAGVIIIASLYHHKRSPQKKYRK